MTNGQLANPVLSCTGATEGVVLESNLIQQLLSAFDLVKGFNFIQFHEHQRSNQQSHTYIQKWI